MHDTHHMTALARALGALRQAVHELCAWYAVQKRALQAGQPRCALIEQSPQCTLMHRPTCPFVPFHACRMGKHDSANTPEA